MRTVILNALVIDTAMDIDRDKEAQKQTRMRLKENEQERIQEFQIFFYSILEFFLGVYKT